MSQPSLDQIVEQNSMALPIEDLTRVALELGSCSLGVVGQLYKFAGGNTSSVRSRLGYGPLADAVMSKTRRGFDTWAIPTACTTAGAIGQITSDADGTAIFAATGAPFDDFSVVVEAVSATKIIYTLDGVTYSPPVLLSGANRSYAIPGSGITVAFGSTGTIVAGDKHSFPTTAPVWNLTDIESAIDAALAIPDKPGFLHLVGQLPYEAAVVASLSAVTKTGDGPELTVSGTPVTAGAYDVEITTTGGRGAGKFRYRIGTGAWVEEITIPADGSYVIGATGITALFADSSYPDGDLHEFTAVTAVASSVARLFSLVDGKMTGAFASHCPIFTVIELPSQTDATMIAATEGLVSAEGRIMQTGRFHAVTVPQGYVGRAQARRSLGYSIAGWISKCEMKEDLGKVELGPLPDILSIEVDESVTPGFGAARIECLRTHKGLNGFYVNSDTVGNMASQPGSDFTLVEFRRVMDRVCQLGRIRGLLSLNKEFRANPQTGGIAETDAIAIENDIYSYICSEMGDQFTALSVRLDRTTSVISSRELVMYFSIISLVYAKRITQRLSFANPLAIG